MKKLCSFFLFLSVIIASPLYAGSIKIGLLGPMTGSMFNEGQEMKRVVSMMVDDLNSNGGLLGRKVQLVVADDAGNPKKAVIAARKLIQQKVVAVIGSFTSGATEASQPLFHKANIVQITNASTLSQLTEKGFANFFRICSRDDEQTAIALKAFVKMKLKRIAILHDNSRYAKALAEEVKKEAPAQNIDIVFFDAIKPGADDYKAVLSKIKFVAPDCLFYTGYYSEAGVLLRQKAEMGLKFTFMGGDATNNPAIMKVAGKEATEGFYFLSVPLPGELESKEAKQFISRYESKFSDPPESIYAVLAGDAFTALTAAIKKTKSTNAKDISGYMHEAKDIVGFTGPLTFDASGDRITDLYGVYRIDAKGRLIPQRFWPAGQ